MDFKIRKFGRKDQMKLAGVLAALSLLVVGLELYAVLGSESQVSVLSIKWDLPRGHRIEMGDLQNVQTQEPGQWLTDQQLHEVRGARLREPLKAGALLSWEHLMPSKAVRLGELIPQGKRAYSFVYEAALEVLAGDWVDIHVSNHNPGGVSELLVQAARVLRVRPERSKSYLTVAIKPEEIKLLEMAARRGTLTIVLRNPNEKARQEPSFKWGKRRKRVEVWQEESE